MNGLPWFRFFPSDWMGGTAYMTKADKSDYLALLLAQWQSGPIPDVPEVLASILGGQPSDAVRAKFEAVAGKLTNIRLEQEREWSTTKSDASRKRKERFRERVRNASGTRSRHVPERFASDSDSHIPLGIWKGTGEKHEPNQGAKEPRRPKPDFPPDFSECWAAYPDKSGSKHKAFQAYRASFATKEQVLDGIARYIAHVEAKRQNGFSSLRYQNGQTWFNGRGWLTEYETTNTRGKDEFADTF